MTNKLDKRHHCTEEEKTAFNLNLARIRANHESKELSVFTGNLSKRQRYRKNWIEKEDK